MIIELHSKYIKAFNKRIANNPKLVGLVSEKVRLFQEDPSNPNLKNHRLKGTKRELSAFSVSGNIRIIYIAPSTDHATFIDIGSHNQVY